MVVHSLLIMRSITAAEREGNKIKKYPPKRPINSKGVCYTDRLCDIKKDCSECKNLNPNGTIEDLKSGERKSIGSWL